MAHGDQDQETFLVVLQSSSSEFCQSFLWQGSWEDVYRLKHDTWNLSVFLLAPEEPQSWSGYGTQLIRVVDIRAIHAAFASMERSLWELSRLAPAQRSVEAKLILERLQREESDALQVTFDGASETDLERLKRLGIQPLSTEEVQKLRRN